MDKGVVPPEIEEALKDSKQCMDSSSSELNQSQSKDTMESET